MSRKKRRVLVECKDYPGRCRHHLTAKTRGGDNSPENVALLALNKHAAFHTLFGNKTLEEAILLLVRLHRIKGRCLYGAMGKRCNLAPCISEVPAQSNGHKTSRPGRRVFKMLHH